ncbi:MAG: hypothetical protein PHW64_01860 [Sulfuricurvum sp.]|nr:hypothetical protein [Sulfuricurvum sp.]
MRRSLGRIVLGIVICGAVVWGEAFRWSVVESPRELYVNQSAVIRYECAFENSAGDYTIVFKPSSTEIYDAEVLTQTDRVINGKRIQTFDILITPKREGSVTITLDALIRHTTFASIENATIGRDNVKKYDFNDEKAILPTVTINAKANSAALTGKIAFLLSADRRSVRAHEPVHVSLMIQGSGNLDHYTPIDLNISGVKVFAEPPQKNITPSVDGYEGEIRQEFALVAEKSYTIPPLSLTIFDTGAGKMKTLTAPMIRIEVEEGYEPLNLLDPPDLSDYATLKRYGMYTALVLLGIVLGEGARWVWKYRPRRQSRGFWEQASSVKELTILLALSGEKRYDPIIAELEAGTMSLSEAKKKLSHTTRKVTA